VADAVTSGGGNMISVDEGDNPRLRFRPEIACARNWVSINPPPLVLNKPL